MIVILLGLIGAGKGTQAKMLVDSMNFLHIATGDLFRNAVKKQTKLGIEIEKYMNNGELVPDELTIKMLLDSLNSMNQDADLLLDGFPRTASQCVALDEALTTKYLAVDYAINIHVSEEILLERIAKRAEIENRKDDKPEIAKRRLTNQQIGLQEVMTYYTNADKLLEIDGVGTVEDIHQRILKQIQAEKINS
jgi:adenylate kinase